jgi:SAM-dependent methyltransferase
MDYYTKNAQEYIEKTQSIDMTTEINKFLEAIDKIGTILDLGFGSGKDSLYFQNLGYEVYSIDPTKEFCENGRKIGLTHVIEGCAQDIDFQEKFDGIWACASLLHISSEDLIQTLKKCKNALKQDGFMYASFKYGEYEGVRDDRFYNDMTLEKFVKICDKSEMDCLESWITYDKQNRGNKWINFLLCK